MIHALRTLPILDIFLTVVDNLGDMGFAGEVIYSLRKNGFSGKIHLYTNEVQKTENFFEKAFGNIENIEIFDLSKASECTSQIVLSLFHTEIPVFQEKKKRLILRIDYLSFDPDWVKMTGKEHIFSTDETQIIEIVPSFLGESAGVLTHKFSENTRLNWLQKNNLPENLVHKTWLILFIYDATYDRIEFDLSKDWVIFIFGRSGKSKNKQQIFPGFLNLEQYYSLFHLADVNIVRGDGSIVQAFQTGKPFLWDIYKEIGGFPESISNQYMDFLNSSKTYRDLHKKFNTGEKKLSLEKIVEVLTEENSKNTFLKNRNILSLVTTMEKYIDSFDFSI